MNTIDQSKKKEALYEIKHLLSGSACLLKCRLNKDNKAQLVSARMLKGKVISLDLVRQALEKTQSKTEPPATDSNPEKA